MFRYVSEAMIPKEFICVTSLVDGKRALVRSSCIDAVYENDAEDVDYGRKPSCVTLCHGSSCLDVCEGFDEVCNMIYNAEL